jgi:hypothetical protein
MNLQVFDKKVAALNQLMHKWPELSSDPASTQAKNKAA